MNDCRIRRELLGMLLTSFNEKSLTHLNHTTTSVFLQNLIYSHVNFIENPIMNEMCMETINLYSFFSSCKVLFIAVPVELKPIHSLFVNNVFHAIHNKD